MRTAKEVFDEAGAKMPNGEFVMIGAEAGADGKDRYLRTTPEGQVEITREEYEAESKELDKYRRYEIRGTVMGGPGGPVERTYVIGGKDGHAQARRERLSAVIEKAILDSKNDRSGLYVHDFVCDAVEKFMDEEKEPAAPSGGTRTFSLDTLQCFACGKESPAPSPTQATWGPIRCACGGQMLHKPEAQTTITSREFKGGKTLNDLIDDGTPKR